MWITVEVKYSNICLIQYMFLHYAQFRLAWTRMYKVIKLSLWTDATLILKLSRSPKFVWTQKAQYYHHAKLDTSHKFIGLKKNQNSQGSATGRWMAWYRPLCTHVFSFSAFFFFILKFIYWMLRVFFSFTDFFFHSVKSSKWHYGQEF